MPAGRDPAGKAPVPNDLGAHVTTSGACLHSRIQRVQALLFRPEQYSH
jgi:hypothetical protein